MGELQGDVEVEKGEKGRGLGGKEFIREQLQPEQQQTVKADLSIKASTGQKIGVAVKYKLWITTGPHTCPLFRSSRSLSLQPLWCLRS